MYIFKEESDDKKHFLPFPLVEIDIWLLFLLSVELLVNLEINKNLKLIIIKILYKIN